MKVLVITGDKTFGPGNPRFELQRGAMDRLESVYWGRGSVNPKIPKEEFDVVTVQDPFMRGLFAWHVSRRLKARFNVQVHTDLRAQGLIRRVLARRVLRRAASVRVVSETIKNQVLGLGVRAPITVLPIYIDLSKFIGLPRQPHPRFKKVALWIGRFEPEKDPLKALAVLVDIRRELPDAGLVMLGSGSLEPLLRERAERLGLSEYVEFPGWQPPQEYLAQADVVLCTSHYEGYGASIVEALASGVPVVAPDVGVAKEAGAIVVERAKLAPATIEALRSSARGELKLPRLNEAAWIEAWTDSL